MLGPDWWKAHKGPTKDPCLSARQTFLIPAIASSSVAYFYRIKIRYRLSAWIFCILVLALFQGPRCLSRFLLNLPWMNTLGVDVRLFGSHQGYSMPRAPITGLLGAGTE